MSAITEWDFSVLDVISGWRNDVLTPVMKALSYAGTGGIIWIAVCILLIIYPKTRKIGIFAAAALTMEYLLGDLCIKNLVARERPFVQHPWIDTIISHPSGYSFPSGHTASAVSVTAAVFIQNKKLSIPFIVLAVSIMFSRLYFCVHFPTDILFGIVHGVIWAVVTWLVIKTIAEKKDIKLLKK
ncbi:MAG: phosphatase PAP2 family protein [Ruminococcus sp.]|nr:phosphatase PAP2 family protein [Ruminococcus sp.]